MTRQPPVGQGLLIITLRHTTLGGTPLDESSARRREFYNTLYSQETDFHAAGGIRTHNPSKRAAADLRLRPRCHWDGSIPSIFNSNIRT
jgi:hypothetical protein